MRKRLIIIALAVPLIAALALTIRHFRPQPRYQGKTAAEWFQEFCLAERLYYSIPMQVRMGGSNAVVHGLDTGRWHRDPSADGLRGLGTNAALFLAREICRDDPSWAPAYRKAFFKLPRPVKFILPSPPTQRLFVRRQARVAFGLLGSNGAPAVPILIAGLKSPDQYTRVDIIEALRPLPRNPEDVNPMLENLARRGQHSNAVEVIDGLGLRTKTAAIVLGEAVTSGNAETKMKALRQLSSFGPTAAPAVPPLITALATTNSELRYSATSALADIGPGAHAAVPALNRLTNDTSQMVQRAATRALSAIGTGEKLGDPNH